MNFTDRQGPEQILEKARVNFDYHLHHLHLNLYSLNPLTLRVKTKATLIKSSLNAHLYLLLK